ncbi:MAG: response regulator [Ferruginibacter sp.]|nr:response regulator [Ferruginibacter sp.]
MSTIRKYIIVDDDYFNNILSTMLIENALGKVDIRTFQVPEKALEFIQDEFIKYLGPTIVFLDINMPTLNAWEFMEEYEKFSEAVKKQISIYIVSSSVDRHDKDKAEANKYITGFISKPLEHETILSVAGV